MIDPISVVIFAGASLVIVLLLGLAMRRSMRADPAIPWLNAANASYLTAISALLMRDSIGFEIASVFVIAGAYVGICLGFTSLLRAEERRAPLKTLGLIGVASIGAQAGFSGTVDSVAPLLATSSLVNSALSLWMSREVWRLIRPRGREIALLVTLPFAMIFTGYFLRLLSLAFLSIEAALLLTVVIIALLAKSSLILALGLIALRERQARRALNAALEKVEAASEAKSRFLYGVSHELRTPLNGVLGLSELMRQEALGALPDPYRRFTGEIHRNGERLLELVSDLLDIAGIEQGEMKLEEREIDLDEMLATLAARHAGAASERGLVFTCRRLPGAPRRIVADGPRLCKMLSHLVGNAVKYAPEGGSVAVRIRSTPEGGARFSIKDDGPGLSEQEIAVALELFGRVGGVDNPANGSGVGLTLAAEIAKAHGGALRIKSEKGRGAAVSVPLPAARTQPETEPLQPESAA